MIKGRSFTKPGYYDSVGGKVHTGAKMKFGVNSAFANYFGQEFAFINQCKVAAIILTNPVPGTVDSNGYVDVTTSGSYSLQTHTALAGSFGGMATGIWVLRWTGTATVNWSGGTETASSANRKEYTVTDPDIDGIESVTISGGTCTNVELLHPGEEANFDAGNILTTQFKSDWTGIAVFRTMDWQNTSVGPSLDYADINTYTYINWFNNIKTGAVGQVNSGIPIRALCEACNELACDPWINIPAMATDACVTSIATDVNTYYTMVGGMVWVENGNEVWNTATPWSNGSKWYTYGDITHVDSTSAVPTTGVITKASHGLTYGDEIACFNNTHHTVWPYAAGRTNSVIVDDANTFRIGSTPGFPYAPLDVVSITKANPAVVEVIDHDMNTGDPAVIFGADMTEVNEIDFVITVIDADHFSLDGVDASAYTTYTAGGKFMFPHNEFTTNGIPGGTVRNEITKIRYKPIAGGAETKQVFYAERCMEVWDLFEAQVSNMWRVGASQSGNTGVTTRQLAVAGFREAIDYLAIAPYFNTRGVAADYENYTNAQHSAYALGTVWDGIVTGNEAHRDALGTYRLVWYECGDHNADTSNETAKRDKLLSWARDTVEATNTYKTYYQNAADIGTKLVMEYKDYGVYGDNTTDVETFGLMEHPGDTDAAEYGGVVDFITGGGVSKS